MPQTAAIPPLPPMPARLALPLLGVLALAGCGPSEQKFAPPCPQLKLLGDAADLTRMRGQGTDLTDLVLQARIAGVNASCTEGSRGSVNASLKVLLEVTRDGTPMKIKVQPDWMPDPDARLASMRPKKAPSSEGRTPTAVPPNPPTTVPVPALITAQGLGVTVRPINPELAETFGLAADRHGDRVQPIRRDEGGVVRVAGKVRS